MSLTLAEFVYANQPCNYFSFSNNTHELVIDVIGKLLTLHPHVDKFSSRSQTNLFFTRGGVLFQQYSMNHVPDEKVVYVFLDDLEVIKFNYLAYFQVKRDAYGDVNVQDGQ
ncbi:MAG: hypothetical protein R2685_12825 [Candidatus Nitrosocosmicus sp.]|nr:hypothetical protein [Candidatus Nitrosocosmicus sp.]